MNRNELNAHWNGAAKVNGTPEGIAALLELAEGIDSNPEKFAPSGIAQLDDTLRKLAKLAICEIVVRAVEKGYVEISDSRMN